MNGLVIGGGLIVGVPSAAVGASFVLRGQSHRRDLRLGSEGSAVRIFPPEKPDPDEALAFWRQMHEFVVPIGERVRRGQGHFCWELRVRAGGPELYLWASSELREWWELRDAVEQGWKGARVEEAELPAVGIDQKPVSLRVAAPGGLTDDVGATESPDPLAWVTTSWRLGRGNAKELRTEGAAFTESFLGHARRGLGGREEVVLQVLARPCAFRFPPEDAQLSKWEIVKVAATGEAPARPAPQPGKEPTRGKTASPPFFDVEVRLAVAAERETRALAMMHTVASTLGTLSGANHLKRRRRVFDVGDRSIEKASVMDVAELAAVAHMPTAALLAGDSRKTIPAPAKVTDKGRHLGLNVGRRVAMPRGDTWEHVGYGGTTGMGKTTTMNTGVLSDIEQGIGVVMCDIAKGNQVQHILKNLPPGRERDLCVIDAEDPTHAVGLNLLDGRRADLNVSNLIALFRQQSAGSWGQVQQDTLRGACMALAWVANLDLSPVKPSLFEVLGILDNKPFREAVLEVIDHVPPDVAAKAPGGRIAAEGHRQFLLGLDKTRELEPLRNKVRNFLAWDNMKLILGQSDTLGGDPFDMLNPAGDEAGVILIRARKGGVGMSSADLLASIAIQRTWAQVLSADRRGPGTSLWLDEVRNLTNAVAFLEDIAAEGREPRLSLNVAWQYLSQLDDKLRNAIEGTINNRVYFAMLNEPDAKLAAHLFAPHLGVTDWRNLGRFRAAVRLSTGPTVFTIDTEPMPKGSEDRLQECLAISRQRWARPKEQVEEEILGRMRDPLRILGTGTPGGGGGGSSGPQRPKRPPRVRPVASVRASDF